MEQPKPFVITISRQLGCGGAQIGQLLAGKLNISYADREIITKAAKQLSMLEDDLQSRDERVLSFWETFFTGITTSEHVSAPTLSPMLEATDDELFQTEAGIIGQLADEHSSVIIGRCGFNILREHPNHVSIFLHADKEFRSERLQKELNAMKSYAEEQIEKSDKERAVYCKRFTRLDWTDARNYDISIDTSKLGIDKTTELILNFIKFRLSPVLL
jgi:cytidylate kinase